MIVAAHVALVAVLSRPAPTLPPAPVPVFEIVEHAVKVAQLPPPPMTEVVVLPTIEAPAIEMAPEPASAETGDDCRMIEMVGDALSRDRAAAAAIDLIPPATRSVANTTMLWDGQWVDASTLGPDASLSAIRAAVAGAVRATAAPCRTARVTGPRLVIVADGGRTAALVFGSGVWTWEQLL